MAGEGDWQQTLDECDDATAQLIIQFQLADIREFAEQAGDDSHSNDNVALLDWDKTLRQYRTVRQLEGEETQVAVPSANAASGETVDRAQPTSLQPPTAAIEETHPTLFFQCTSCGDSKQVEEIWQVPCQHHYCDNCLRELFTLSMRDQSLFPPRCCQQPIPFDDVRQILGNDIATRFAAVREELQTPNALYCNIRTCSAFIPPSNQHGNIATCPREGCLQQTCVHCRNAAHQDDCPRDEALQVALQVAVEQGYQRCSQCRNMIELTMGCNHITCHCRHQFCYECGATWKTCQCPQFREDRLLERAQVIANRDGRGGNRAVVAAEVEHLRRNHECEHRAWRSRDGRNVCEECTDVMPQFIYECRRCRILVCRRCRRNRL